MNIECTQLQQSVCEERFKRIDRELELTQERMMRIENKMDKILFRLTAMIVSTVIFLVSTGIGFLQMQMSSTEKAYSIIREYKSVENQKTIDDYLQKKTNSVVD